MKGPLLAAVGTLLVALALAAFLASRSVSRVAPPPGAYHWPIGKELSYKVRWTVSRAGPLGAGEQQHLELGGELDLDLHVAVARAAGDGYTLRYRIGQVRAHRVELDGQDALGQAPPLQGATALVELDRRAAVRELAFESTLPEQSREVLERLVRQMQITFPAAPDPTWEAVERGLQGSVRVRYRRYLEDGRLVTRERLADEAGGEPTSFGAASIRFDDAGVLVGLDDEQELRVGLASARSSFQAWRERTGLLQPRDLESAAYRARPRPSGMAAYDWTAHDRRISAGIDWHALSSNALSFERGRPLPDGFLSGVGGYLRLNPGEHPKLLEHFVSAGVSTRMRQLILDFWGAAGDGPAQAAMREALASAAALENREAYVLYVQRLGLLARPEPETAAFVEATYRKHLAAADELLASASAVTLGGIVRGLRGSDRPELAFSAHAVLVAELRRLLAAPDPVQPELRIALIQALGNAAVPQDLPLLEPLLASRDWAVRDQAAYSLRHITTPQARQALVPLTKDPVPSVAISAVRALTAHPLDAAHWQSLAAAVGESNREADSTLARAVGRHQEDAAEHGLVILKAISTRVPSRDIDLRSLVDTLIAAQETAVSG